MRFSQHFLFFGRQISPGCFFLDAEETRHAVAALRVKAGTLISVTDGKGVIYACRLVKAGTDGAELSIVSTKNISAPAPRLCCFIGIPEKDRLADLLENIAALGIAELTPVVCDFCQDQWWKSAWEKQTRRFEKKIIAGMKQSLNPWLPLLHPPLPFEKALRSGAAMILHADPDAETTLAGINAQDVTKNTQIDCWIGPPGGFSIRELDALRERKSVAVRLGGFRLRTEMAVTLMCGALRCLCG